MTGLRNDLPVVSNLSYVKASAVVAGGSNSDMLRTHHALTDRFQFDLFLRFTGFGNGTGISV